MTTPTPACDGQINDDLWFPVGVDATRQALILADRHYCQPCPTRQPCHAYALAWDVDGIWAGTTTAQRRRLRDQQGITPRSLTNTGHAGRRTT